MNDFDHCRRCNAPTDMLSNTKARHGGLTAILLSSRACRGIDAAFMAIEWREAKRIRELATIKMAQ